jgi:MCRA family
MTAHIVGGGFGGLAAAPLLIRNAGVSGADITIYGRRAAGAGFFLGGKAGNGYNLPGSVFDKEFLHVRSAQVDCAPSAPPPFSGGLRSEQMAAYRFDPTHGPKDTFFVHRQGLR